MKGTTWTVRAVGWSSAPEVGEQMLAHQLTTVMVRNVHLETATDAHFAAFFAHIFENKVACRWGGGAAASFTEERVCDGSTG